MSSVTMQKFPGSVHAPIKSTGELVKIERM
jgi:hypothetical protein